jgi:hypothetical protein
LKVGDREEDEEEVVGHVEHGGAMEDVEMEDVETDMEIPIVEKSPKKKKKHRKGSDE